GDRLLVEAGADVAGVLEPAAATHREHERAERRRAATLPLRVAGDQELLAAGGLDLEPFARPAADGVRRVGPLGDDPLEPLLLGRLEERVAVVEQRREPYVAVPAVEQRVKALAPLGERERDHGLTVDLEHVEDLVDDRRPGLSLLHRRKARPSLLVER